MKNHRFELEKFLTHGRRDNKCITLNRIKRVSTVYRLLETKSQYRREPNDKSSIKKE